MKESVKVTCYLYGKKKPPDDTLWRWSHVTFSTFAAFVFIFDLTAAAADAFEDTENMWDISMTTEDFSETKIWLKLNWLSGTGLVSDSGSDAFSQLGAPWGLRSATRHLIYATH